MAGAADLAVKAPDQDATRSLPGALSGGTPVAQIFDGCRNCESSGASAVSESSAADGAVDAMAGDCTETGLSSRSPAHASHLSQCPLSSAWACSNVAVIPARRMS